MIKIDLDGYSFAIIGDIKVISENRRAKSNFESIGALFNDSNNRIIVPFSTEDSNNKFDDKEKQYNAILRLFNKFKIEYEKSEDAIKLVEKIDQENENFKVFSIKAKNIRNNIHKEKDYSDFEVIVRKSMERELYDLQFLSAYHLAFSQNACNFSVPGSGKTTIVYGAYCYLKSIDKNNPKFVDRLLVIGPLSSFAPWKREFKDCFGYETKVRELVGLNRKERQNHYYSNTDYEITLISYQSAANDIDDLIVYLTKHRVMVVLDEAHKIKNVTGGFWAESILRLAKFAKSRVVLTGSPAPNGYHDIYNLFKFIWPTKNIISFPLYYLQNLSKRKSLISQQNLDRLLNDISPFFIRIKKKDLNLPIPIFNEPIFTGMGKIQNQIYKYIEKKYIEEVDQNPNNSFIHKLKKSKLIRLMQCSTNPSLLKRPLDEYLLEEGYSNELGIDDRNIMKLINNYDFESELPPKFIKIFELISMIIKKNGPDGRVIVWATFIGNMIDLQKYLSSQNIESELLYGAIPNENEDTPKNIITREKIINQFHEEDCPFRVIIANPFAVGESISLHKACHNAIYFEKNFNAISYIQSKDRIHRYGLKDNDKINYYFLISSDTIEYDIHERVLLKEKRMLDVIENSEIPLFSQDFSSENEDEDDIRAILKSYHERKNP
ncbi:MAG: DEAD/DEAH box helicase [Vallitaleaceae bacterium]|nr:DEAD/DEAH box helicase [Vallitaleaceae bacterium]